VRRENAEKKKKNGGQMTLSGGKGKGRTVGTGVWEKDWKLRLAQTKRRKGGKVKYKFKRPKGFLASLKEKGGRMKDCARKRGPETP